MNGAEGLFFISLQKGRNKMVCDGISHFVCIPSLSDKISAIHWDGFGNFGIFGITKGNATEH